MRIALLHDSFWFLDGKTAQQGGACKDCGSVHAAGDVAVDPAACQDKSVSTDTTAISSTAHLSAVILQPSVGERSTPLLGCAACEREPARVLGQGSHFRSEVKGMLPDINDPYSISSFVVSNRVPYDALLAGGSIGQEEAAKQADQGPQHLHGLPQAALRNQSADCSASAMAYASRTQAALAAPCEAGTPRLQGQHVLHPTLSTCEYRKAL